MWFLQFPGQKCVTPISIIRKHPMSPTRGHSTHTCPAPLKSVKGVKDVEGSRRWESQCGLWCVHDGHKSAPTVAQQPRQAGPRGPGGSWDVAGWGLCMAPQHKCPADSRVSNPPLIVPFPGDGSSPASLALYRQDRDGSSAVTEALAVF